MIEPGTAKQLRGFVSMMYYYESLWPKRSLKMTLLLAMPGECTTFKLIVDLNKAFNDVQDMVAQDTLLTRPDLTKPFDIYTDASKWQIVDVVSQERKPVGYRSKKFNAAQQNYTVTEKELLSIVESLRYFKTILLGQNMTVCTDHKNLTYI